MTHRKYFARDRILRKTLFMKKENLYELMVDGLQLTAV